MALRPVTEIRILSPLTTSTCGVTILCVCVGSQSFCVVTLTLGAAEKYRSVFKEFPFFNMVQSKVFDDVS